LDDNILAICKCADQATELPMMTATCQRAQDKITDIKLMFMNHPISIPSELRRNRRQILIAATLLISTLSGLFSAARLFHFAGDAGDTADNQDTIVEVLAQHEVATLRNTAELQIMNNTLHLLHKHLNNTLDTQHQQEVHNACIYESFNTITHLDALLIGLHALMNDRVHPILIQPQTLIKVAR